MTRVVLRARIGALIGALIASTASVAHGQEPARAERLVRFAVRALDGVDVRVGPGERPTLVAVFATWCRSCKDEVATLNAMQHEYSMTGVRVLAVSAGDEDSSHVQRWTERLGAAYPIATDADGAIARALGVVGVPEFHLISGAGRELFTRRGPIGSTLSALRAAIAALPNARPK
ncbi:MAG TPA: TlpA disulfide reductase family protein [Gemmatimonadaceae bacterium]|nr:TlpA disulfide reductase family protein [Gemmatimonadaceae bacterium]